VIIAERKRLAAVIVGLPAFGTKCLSICTHSTQFRLAVHQACWFNHGMSLGEPDRRPEREGLMIRIASLVAESAATHGWLILLVISLSLNLYLGARLRNPPSQRPPEAKIGTVLPTVIATLRADETTAPLSFAGGTSETVVYVMSSLCIWCWRNEPSVLSLKGCVESQGRRFVAVALNDENMDRYFDYRPEPYPVYLDRAGEFRQSVMIGSTPMTILADANGKVVRVWAGAYTQNTARKVSDHFGCSLEGLREPPANWGATEKPPNDKGATK